MLLCYSWHSSLFFIILMFICLQIYEGTAQIQRIIIGREWMGIAKDRLGL